MPSVIHYGFISTSTVFAFCKVNEYVEFAVFLHTGNARTVVIVVLCLLGIGREHI